MVKKLKLLMYFILLYYSEVPECLYYLGWFLTESLRGLIYRLVVELVRLHWLISNTAGLTSHILAISPPIIPFLVLCGHVVVEVIRNSDPLKYLDLMEQYQDILTSLSIPKPPVSDDVALSLKAAELLSEGGWTPEESAELERILYGEPPLRHDVALTLKVVGLWREEGLTPEESAKLLKFLSSKPPVSIGEAVLAQKRESMQAALDNPEQENSGRYFLGLCLIVVGTVALVLFGHA